MYDLNNIIDTTMNDNILAAMAIGIGAFGLILFIILIISYCKILKKVGKPVWIILIPIYNIIVLIQAAIRLHKSVGYILGMIFLPIIFIPLLAFSNDEVTETKEEIKEEINSELVKDNQEIKMVPEESQNLDTSLTNEETINSNVLNENSVVEESSIAPVEIENNNIETIPTTNPEVVANEPIINNIEETKEPATPIIEQSVIENVPSNEPVIEPVTLDTIETTNETMEENNVVEEEPILNVEPINNNGALNAFNINTIDENKEEPEPIIEIEENNTIDTNKKVCKNCGAELPDIVSICPNCGTDNE